MNDQPTSTFVYKRPFVEKFLSVMSNYYDLVIFTASDESYANAIIEKLDPQHTLFKARYYRKDCTSDANGNYIKDLRRITGDLRQILLVDNNPMSYHLQPHNGIPIKSWIFYQKDSNLKKLVKLLKRATFLQDVRLHTLIE
jgi:Dullard-like phosphatase family protein